MEKLSLKLGYQFKNPAVLTQALRHCSVGKDNNERLEFLGDSVLGLIVSELLYQQFPNASEGELSRIRASMVQQSSLAAIARSLNLGEHLKLGVGELKSGGINRDSILADAVEAVICALYLDAGLDVCRAKVVEWFSPKLSEYRQAQPAKDPKTSLQEFLQARRLPLPVYNIVDILGKEHQQQFVVDCAVVLLKEPERGKGNSRKEAEQQAALAVMKKLYGNAA